MGISSWESQLDGGRPLTMFIILLLIILNSILIFRYRYQDNFVLYLDITLILQDPYHTPICFIPCFFQHLPVFAVSNKFFNGIWSFYHQRRMNFDFMAQFFIKRQHILFYPILFLARFNLYLQSFLLLLRPKEAIKRGVTYPRLELIMIMGFHYWLFQIIRTFPTWTESIVFLLLSHGLAGILHLQICLSHFPMEVLDGNDEKPLEKTDFLKQQVSTCLDIACHSWVDWFHGGLHFQTSHHLFPLMPRHKLRQVTPLVEELCKKHKLKYNILPFWDANCTVIKCLRQTADQLHPWLYALANAEG